MTFSEKRARWDQHFIRLCIEHARMSKDPDTQVGSIIVGPHNEIISAGFNGFPRGIADTAERLQNKELKKKLVVHAEMNAILAAARHGIRLDGTTLYLAATDDSCLIWGGAPCTRCTVEMMQAGITSVVSLPFKAGPSSWVDDVAFARGLLEEADITYREVEQWTR